MTLKTEQTVVTLPLKELWEDEVEEEQACVSDTQGESWMSPQALAVYSHQGSLESSMKWEGYSRIK